VRKKEYIRRILKHLYHTTDVLHQLCRRGVYLFKASQTHVQCAILELKDGPAQFPQPTDLRHAVLSAVAGRQAAACWHAVEVRPLPATEDASVRRVHVSE